MAALLEGTFVNRKEFEEKLILLYENQNGNRGMASRKQLDNMKNILKESQSSNCERKKGDYYFLKKYELLEIGNERHVILKRMQPSDQYVYLVAYEDHFPKLVEAHCQSGHGGRDRTLDKLKGKSLIPRSAVDLFVSCCSTCNRKKPAIREGVVIKPIIMHGFNVRAPVDLVDFQSCPDGDYNWLMDYQDHATKFVQLRPQKTKQAREVAEEVEKIFSIFGAPHILQSDNGREFAAAVIHELVLLFPYCRLINGRPRHPASQGSVERANGDVKGMLRAWILDNKWNNWSKGCWDMQVIKTMV